MANATPRVLVDDVDELLNCVFAIADDMPRLTFRSGDQFAIDDQQSVIESLNVTFNDDSATMIHRLFEANLDFVGRLQID